MKIYQKILVLILGITVLGGVVFGGLNYYEAQKQCIWEIDMGISPFIVCKYPVDEMFERFNKYDVKKPLILLYPTKPTHIDVKLEYNGAFTATFPEYSSLKKGWSVEASPESIIKDQGTGQETYGLFWEGKDISTVPYDMSHGFVMRGSEVREFLYSSLRKMNLTPKEYSDFIMFWYPKLQDYPYVQITFAGKDYADRAKLTITPAPDNILRVFMVVKPLREPQEIPMQNIEKFHRDGFHVLEWGGTIIQ